MNDTQILQSVEDVWHHHCAALEEAIDETVRGLQNLIRLDEYHRHGHEEGHLKDTLGPFAASNLNLSSLSEVLDKSGATRRMPEGRLNRINELLERLGEIRKACNKETMDVPVLDIGEDEKSIHVQAEKHLNRVADMFACIRKAQLEIRSKYNPAIHDDVFDNFNWRLLSPAEMSLSPQVVIIARLTADSGDILRKVMSLLESRKPFKIAAMRTSLKKAYSPTADPMIPASMSVETLPIAMRGVYFLQTCPADEKMKPRLFAALTSPRPTLISLLENKADESQQQYLERAGKAMRCRAFASVVYNPDISNRFGTCFDLTSNPDAEETYSFADFAVEDPDYMDEFSDPPEGFSANDLVPINDYMELVRHQRVGKLPSIRKPDGGDGKLMVVSQAIVTQTSDVTHLWKTLQEIAGLDNPFVQSTAATLREEHGAQQKALLENMQKDMEESQQHRENVAVASAVQRLVSQLTGVDSTEIDLQYLVTMGSSASAPEASLLGEAPTSSEEL